MANYLFERMTDEQALSYNPTNDSLFFLDGSASTVGVQYNAGNSVSNPTITLTNGGVSHVFLASALAGEAFTFFGDSEDESTLAFGSNTGVATTVAGTLGFGARFYALGGDDTVTGSVASDTIYGGDGADRINGTANASGSTIPTDSDYLNGGAGADTIIGSAANEHIWGNESTTAAGTVDGADSILAGAGKDYVNGNGGDDFIDGGADNDRLFGGAGADTILGGTGFDSLQGNKGNDSLDGGAGNDTLRGGADNDVLNGGADQDMLMGDAGADTLIGGAGVDTLMGGEGGDRFQFSTNSATTHFGTATTGTNADPLAGQVETINDFANSLDKIALGNTVAFGAGDVIVGAASQGDANAAQTYAAGLLAGHTGNNEVAAVQVGSDTYLFYNDTFGSDTVNSAIKLVGVSAANVDSTDFVL